jgi:hypothetical protein
MINLINLIMNTKKYTKMKKLSLFLLMLFIAGSISAQNITVTLPEIPTPGATVAVPLTVTAIDAQVLTFQVYVQYDPAVLTYASTTYPNPNLSAAEWQVGNAGGEWGGNWFNADFTPETILAGDVLCVVNFTYVSGDTPLNWGLTKGNVPVKGQTLFFDPGFNVFIQDLVPGCIAGSCGTVGTPGLWTGAQSSAWDVGGNWDDGMVPGETADIVIPGVTKASPPVLTFGPVLVGSLTILDGGMLTIAAGGSLTVSGLTQIDGNGAAPDGLLLVQGGSFIDNGFGAGAPFNGDFRY